ncbi:energy-coupling factor ABC transporter permease [uncultured Alistipes sp.]|uniref:energy-coupling factor ABC transporter permease n=1 Tax=uncultured Alistipes sp. TaxID=538949 RepID=UPI0025991D7D|nr:energy-coupling factor ABC transporter permease [uncultured Alistipes sp.]
MHMSDALVSPTVAAVAGTASLVLLGTAVRKLRPARSGLHTDALHSERIVPLMGVMGAFVFAAQMINFVVPGTGSSGHIVGGILLSAILGPWAALLALSSVLILQCLLFADGGFLALGCNIFNMAVLSCLVAYPLVFRPLMRPDAAPGRIFAASVLASVAGLELGALAVTLETEASGITALPIGKFLLFMLPIHLAIGIGEGLATGALLCAMRRYRPELLAGTGPQEQPAKRRFVRTLAVIAVAALLVGGSFSWLASSQPDGLEWSLSRTAGTAEMAPVPDDLHRTAAAIQETTAALPDYGTTTAGLVGCGVLLLAAWGGTQLLRTRRKRA